MKDEIPVFALSSRSGIVWVLWIGFTLLVVYPLSTGPLVRLWAATGSASLRQSIEAFYTPLILLCDHFEPAEDFFEWYISDLWGVP